MKKSRCKDSYLMLDKIDKFCGARRPELITEKCGTSFELTYIVDQKPSKGFKVFYESKNFFIYSYSNI